MAKAVDEKDPRFLRVRALAMQLQGVTEKLSFGYPNWRTTKSQFAAYNDFKGYPMLYVFVEEELASAALRDARYVDGKYPRGGKRWLGLRLDQQLDWKEVTDLLERAHRAAEPLPKKNKPARKAPRRR